jgi:hypothetical protein
MDSLLGELLDTREDFALEELEGRATTSTDMGELVLRTVLSDNCRRVATANDHNSALARRLDRRVEERLGASSKVVELKDARRAVGGGDESG